MKGWIDRILESVICCVDRVCVDRCGDRVYL